MEQCMSPADVQNMVGAVQGVGELNSKRHEQSEMQSSS